MLASTLLLGKGGEEVCGGTPDVFVFGFVLLLLTTVGAPVDGGLGKPGLLLSLPPLPGEVGGVRASVDCARSPLGNEAAGTEGAGVSVAGLVLDVAVAVEVTGATTS